MKTAEHRGRPSVAAEKPALSPRVESLKGVIFGGNPKVCVERARFVTESYRENEPFPTVIRRALGLAKTLQNMTIFILDGELIVGNQISAPRGVPVFPEMACRWIEEELPDIRKRPEKFEIGEEDAKLLAGEILPYWKGRSVQDLIYGALSPELQKDLDSGVFNLGLHLSKGIGHFLLDYGKVLEVGCEGVLREVEERAALLDPAVNPGDVEKRHFLEAVRIVYEAVIRFCERYAGLAEREASRERSATRREELLEIALICRKVPARPAESFREALQAFWFIQLVPHIDSDGTAISPGRFDLYMGPYLEKDLERGVITPDQAQDLVDQLWLKFNQILSLWKAEDARYFGGFPISQNLIVGGVDKGGRDVTNTLSYLCLRATERLKLPQPALSARLHGETPPEFLDAIVQVIATGSGMPALFNDEVVVPALRNRGAGLQDARDYAIIGCVEPGWQGRGCCVSNAAYFNLLKCLELTLGNGATLGATPGCGLPAGERAGPQTGEPADFRSMDDLLAAYEAQICYWVKRRVAIFNTIETIHARVIPFPFNSALVHDCLKEARDYMSGGARYNLNGTQGVGIANVADSLTAIKRLVYDEGRLALPELVQVLRMNYEKQGDLRCFVASRLPRYGNDEEEADGYARFCGRVYCREVEKYVSPRGAKYHPGLYPVSANVPLGKCVAASPDGRLAGEPLADGIAPSHGADRKGPTAVLLSASKLDQFLASNGTQLNQKFPHSLLGSDKMRAKFAHYLRTFVSLPVMEVQFNVVNRDTLLEAQALPDRHRDLVVRVAGYSAFFNDLDRSTQDDIIGRTEQTLG